MPVFCSAIGCSNHRTKCGKTSFHRFPLSNSELLREWLVKMRRDERRDKWRPTKFSYICSDHFSPEHLIKQGTKTYLTKNAVPWRFVFTKSTVTQRKPPKLRSTESSNNNVGVASSQCSDKKSATAAVENTAAMAAVENTAATAAVENTAAMAAVENTAAMAAVENTAATAAVENTAATAAAMAAQAAETVVTSAAAVLAAAVLAVAMPCSQCVSSTDENTAMITVPCSQCSESTDENATTAAAVASAEVHPAAACGSQYSPKTPGSPSTTASQKLHDHSYNTTPRTVKRKLTEEITKRVNLQKRLKVESAKSRRRKKKIDTLLSVINQLRDSNILPESENDILEQCFGGISLQKFFVRSSNPINESNIPYPDDVKQFALTLHFYSPKAYRFVREYIALPHEGTLRKWSSVLDCEPGFTDDSFKRLRHEVINSEHPVLVSIASDAMAIKKHFQFNGKHYVGYVDLGQHISNDSLPLAKETTVFLAVGVNSNWKIPLGYFLTEGLSAVVLSNLMRECLIKVIETGAIPISVVADGASANISMFNKLGANILPTEITELRSSFPCPVTDNPIFVILDPSHMIKLVRNSLGEIGALKMNKNDSEYVQWSYIEKLHNLQEKEGLRAANKLKPNHINWKQQKMKVCLATQVLSRSVSKALLFCKSLGIPEFEGCETTAKFLEFIDHLFDIMNSKNPYAKGTKSALKQSNIAYTRKFLLNAKTILRKLWNVRENKEFYKSGRKTFVIGFLANIDSILGIFDRYCAGPNPVLKYLLTFKLSQDHLEIFFSCIRQQLGHNNNPTCLQLKNAYRKILMCKITPSLFGNCIAQDTTSVLMQSAKEMKVATSECKNTEKSGQNLDNKNIPDYCEYDVQLLSKFSEDVVEYISGFVVTKLLKSFKCKKCISACISDSTTSSLISFKNNNNGLCMPMRDVVKICHHAERCFRMLTSNKPTPDRKIYDKVKIAVMNSFVGITLFSELQKHFMDTTDFAESESHYSFLVKTIVEIFLNVRFHHVAKTTTSQIQGLIQRQKLTKLVHFLGQ